MLFELEIILKLREILALFGNNIVFFACLYFIIPIMLICAFLVIINIFRKIKTLEKKTKLMREISDYIHEGSLIYLKQQAKVQVAILFILLVPVGLTGISFLSNPFWAFTITVITFFTGSLSSLLAGFIGMRAATKANILVVETSFEDPKKGFKLAYYGGMTTGILTISMFVLGIWLIFILTGGNIYLMIAYDFGASISSLLAQVGGGIYTKSADMGADIVGKYEMSIREDDPRNPAIIADLVGDNVGDCAGRGADLFESAAADGIGGMVLALTLFLLIGNPIFIISHLTLILLGLLSLFFTTLFLKIDFNKPSKSIWRVFIASTLFNVVLLFGMNIFLFGELGIFLFISSLMGLISAFVAILFTTYYTSIDFKPTKTVAKSSKESASISIVSGLSTGFKSVFFPVIIFCISVIIAYVFGQKFIIEYYGNASNFPTTNILGSSISPTIILIAFAIWGVNMASIASDTIISTVLSFDTFGPIIDNAAGIAEIGRDEAPEGLRENLAKLDALGNTTKAIAKGFALICGGFSSIVMFFTFLLTSHSLGEEITSFFISSNQLIHIFDYLDFHNPLIITGFAIGTILPVFFTSMILDAVRKGSRRMVEEIRYQFDTIPGLKEGKEGVKPDYDECISISAKTALHNMVKPVLIIIGIVILVGILLGPIVISALLVGNLLGCLIFGLFMSIGGASLDNAKKGIEDGLHGGKGSFAHKASIIGDTFGDPLKDTAGPSMNILITTVNTLSLTFLPLFIMTGFLWALIPIL